MSIQVLWDRSWNWRRWGTMDVCLRERKTERNQNVNHQSIIDQFQKNRRKRRITSKRRNMVSSSMPAPVSRTRRRTCGIIPWSYMIMRTSDQVQNVGKKKNKKKSRKTEMEQKKKENSFALSPCLHSRRLDQGGQFAWRAPQIQNL